MTVTDAHPLVLVVDDYADAREMYAAWLRVSGYRVAVAGTVGDALDAGPARSARRRS